MYFIIKLPLVFISFVYLVIIKCRNYFYDKKLVKTMKLPLPVISIGNISVGGSGKTAVVLELIQKMDDVCVLTRGYKSDVTKNKLYPKEVQLNSTNLFGDEPSLILSKMKKGSVVIDPDRYRGGVFGLQKYPNTKCFILDDGFQHRKLHRDLDIVLFDLSTYQKSLVFTYSLSVFMLLPFGKYREELSSLKRADIILISKWSALEPQIVESLVSKIRSINPNVHFLKNSLSDVINASGEKLDIGNVILFSGLGNPLVFQKDIHHFFPNFSVLDHKKFGDHHRYSKVEVLNLLNYSAKKSAKLVCSEKDYIKIQNLDLGDKINCIYFAKQDLEIGFDLQGQIKSLSADK